MEHAPRRLFILLSPFDYDFCALFCFCSDLFLRCNNARLARIISRYEASVSAAIDMEFLAEVVFVEESHAEARNADKKLS